MAPEGLIRKKRNGALPPLAEAILFKQSVICHSLLVLFNYLKFYQFFNNIIRKRNKKK